MPNPYAGGSERNKLFAYASAKGNSDKSSTAFAESMAGRGHFDVSGGTAVPATLPKSSAAAHSSAR